MNECGHLRGRPRDLCDGVGYSGRPNPTQSASNKYRAGMGLHPIIVSDPEMKEERPQVSQIGTRLAGIFKANVGAIPCQWCLDEINRLNKMTVEQVQSDREAIILTVFLNSQRSATWFVKFKAVVEMAKHCCGPESLIGIYLDEACNAEGDCVAKSRERDKTS